MREKIAAMVFLFILINSNISIAFIQPIDGNWYVPPIIELKAITYMRDPFRDYLNFLKQHLARNNIDLNVEFYSYCEFYDQLINVRDFDIYCMEITQDKTDIDFSNIYGTNGFYNFFGYDSSLDWNEAVNNGINDKYLFDINNDIGTNSSERKLLSWEWQQYLMDKICPIKPLFYFNDSKASWNNLIGYNSDHGLLKSWGKMEWDGLHYNQEAIFKIVIADNQWIELNPLFQYDPSSSFISKLCLDSLFWSESFNYPIENETNGLWPHLVEDYSVINETYIRLKCREGVKWQNDPEGVFISEYFDAYDVYFSLYCWKYLSIDKLSYYWIKDMEIIDEYTLDIYVDNDLTTQNSESFAPLFTKLNVLILPEHFLNQTQLTDGITPDITHSSWESYSSNCFGTSLFEINSYIEDEKTILQLFEDSWWLNDSINSDPDLDFITRFGTFESLLKELHIRIIDDIQTIFLEFESGYLDLVSLDYFSDKKEDYLLYTDFSIYNCIRNRLSFIGFNLREDRLYIGDRTNAAYDPSLTKGLALRKSINYAIDNQEINEVLHNAEASIDYWPIYSTMGSFCNPNIIRYNFDLDKAREYYTMANPQVPTTPTKIIENIKIILGYVLSPIVILLILVPVIMKLIRTRKKNERG